jgi:HSP20 family molecular chaperone IbpA
MENTKMMNKFNKFDYALGSTLGQSFREAMTKYNWLPMTNDVSISETKSHVVYSIDIPGVKRENLSVVQNDDRVEISAERKDRSSESTVKTSFTVAGICDLATLDANLEYGVLTISFTKLNANKEITPRKIDVRVSS